MNEDDAKKFEAEFLEGMEPVPPEFEKEYIGLQLTDYKKTLMKTQVDFMMYKFANNDDGMKIAKVNKGRLKDCIAYFEKRLRELNEAGKAADVN